MITPVLCHLYWFGIKHRLRSLRRWISDIAIRQNQRQAQFALFIAADIRGQPFAIQLIKRHCLPGLNSGKIQRLAIDGQNIARKR